jgi:hypothetical protein
VTRPEPRRFEVQAWMSDRRMVLYVPEIEAATVARDLGGAEEAARDLIAELTGLDPATIACDIRLGPPGGRRPGVRPAP